MCWCPATSPSAAPPLIRTTSCPTATAPTTCSRHADERRRPYCRRFGGAVGRGRGGVAAGVDPADRRGRHDGDLAAVRELLHHPEQHAGGRRVYRRRGRPRPVALAWRGGVVHHGDRGDLFHR